MYIALYRKWRPMTFDDVVGQAHITSTLKNQIILEKTAHAYLFTGTRGTGKTTCAKILAMAFNCTNIKNGNPCLECDSCRSIIDGNNLDVDEIDAASNNRVDNVRQLREDALYMPATSKFRVFIIDETHMLTNEAFNALLKIMEEPPAHVKFILATTEAHKVPATILSRCQRFDFMRIKMQDITQRIMYIAQAEGINITQSAAELVAKLADGAMRDALSILDQCISYSDVIDNDVVISAAGVASREYLFSMTDNILNSDTANAINLLTKLYESSKDMVSFCEELIVHFRNIMVLKTGDQTSEVIAVLPEELEQLKLYAEKISMVQAISYISLLGETLDNMNKFSDKRLNMEIGLVRLTTLKDSESVVEKSSSITKPQGDQNQKIVFLEEKIKALENAVIKLSQQSLRASQQVSSNVDGEENLQKSVVSKPVVRVQEEPLQENTPMEKFESWDEVLNVLSKQDKFIHSIVYNAVVYKHGEFLYIQSPMSNMTQLLKSDGSSTRLIKTIEEVTQIRYKIRIMKNKIMDTDTQTDPLEELTKRASAAGVDTNFI